MSLAALTGARAQDGAEGNTTDVPKTLQTIEQTIDTVNIRKQDLEQTARELAAETEALTRQLIATASQAQAREAQITAAEERLDKLSFEEIVMRGELSDRYDKLAELLAGLQRLEKDPPPPLAVNPSDALSALRGAMLLGSVVPELRAQGNILAKKLARLAALRKAILREQTEITENLGRLDDERREIAHLLQQKQTLTQTIREELETEQKKAKNLAQKAQSLKDLIAKLAQARIEAEQAQRAAEEAQRAAEQAETEERERRRKLRLAKFMKPAIKFSKAHGRLYFPVQGIRTREYGSTDDLGSDTKGVSIATRQFAQVTAPSDGWVAYAGHFRGYGQLLIINAGEGYHVLLAGMEKISVEVGQFVRAGEPVGTMGAKAAQSITVGDQADSAKPVLYVEFRKDGNAINPRPWWAGNDEKVRG